MDVQALSKQSLGVYAIIRAQSGSGRLSLPVKSNQIYANFRHIRGIGSTGDQPAYSVSELRNLDNLIDRLQSLKGGSVQDISVDDLDDEGLSSKIQDYTEQLYDEVHKFNPYRPAVDVSGIAFDMFM